MILTPKHAETITPKRAAQMLKRNAVNRPLRASKVRDYAGRMTRGEWMLNGDTFTFDTDGELIDGQHRAAAVAESGVTIEAFVIHELDPGVRPTVDGGMMRQAADDLAIMGVTDAFHKAGILRAAVLWDRSLSLSTLGGENVTRLGLVELWPKYETAVEEAAPRKAYAVGVPISSGGASLLWWLLRRYGSDPAVIEQFFSIFIDGSQEPKDKVIVRLRKFLDTPRYNQKTGRRISVSKKQEIYYALLAWNGWLNPDDDHPVNFRIPSSGLPPQYPKPYKATVVS